jgi:hypothetical protein
MEWRLESLRSRHACCDCGLASGLGAVAVVAGRACIRALASMGRAFPSARRRYRVGLHRSAAHTFDARLCARSGTPTARGATPAAMGAVAGMLACAWSSRAPCRHRSSPSFPLGTGLSRHRLSDCLARSRSSTASSARHRSGVRPPPAAGWEVGRPQALIQRTGAGACSSRVLVHPAIGAGLLDLEDEDGRLV